MFVTIYTKRDNNGRKMAMMYQTKSHSLMHQRLREHFSDAQTWENPTRVVTDFVPGMRLPCLPLVTGGTRVA
jgi:dGTP triphosphohydrolase